MPQRRLSAILAADVVGYSRLMHADEAGTLARLKAYRNDVFNPVVAQHGGRVVKLMGDGMLVEFQSVIDAVNAAITIQETGRDTPGDELQLRIGVNLGDVIVDGKDIYGEGVNIASRLEALAEPGEVLVSAVVHESVRKRVGARFLDMGPQHLKNIEQPVNAFRWNGIADAGSALEHGPSAAITGGDNTVLSGGTDAMRRGSSGFGSLGPALALAAIVAVGVAVALVVPDGEDEPGDAPPQAVAEIAPTQAVAETAPTQSVAETAPAQPAVETPESAAPADVPSPDKPDVDAPVTPPADVAAAEIEGADTSTEASETSAEPSATVTPDVSTKPEPEPEPKPEPEAALTALTDAGLRRFLNGKTLSGGADFGGDRFAIKFAESGRFEGKVSFDDSFGSAGIDGGQWQAIGDQLCVAFDTLAQGRRLCARVAQDGDAFSFRAPDGSARPWSLAD
ncbi:MAG: adenylate/guanylate cyclase domain-containing protein [Pseudomonadota bacterium]